MKRPLQTLSALHSLLLLVPVVLAPDALCAQGTIYTWGLSSGGLAEVPPGSNYVQVDGAARYSLALRTNGSIVGWGNPAAPPLLDLPTSGVFTLISAGDSYVQSLSTTAMSHAVALTVDGAVRSWGDDTYGQVSQSPLGTGFIQVEAGRNCSYALRADGSIYAWGSNVYSQVAATPTETGFVQVAAGKGHAHALRADGSIVSWGNDGGGVTSDTPIGTGFTQIAAGQGHAVALRSDGSVVSWGSDIYGQVSDSPNGTGFVQVAAGGFEWGVAIGRSTAYALRADGSIVAWGDDGTGQRTNAPTGTGFTQIAGGGLHALALRDENSGSAFCFGDGSGIACPCGNTGGAGQGCANSTGSGGARLYATGHASMTNDSFRITVVGVPENRPGILLRSNTLLGGGQGTPFADGLFCASGLIARSQIQYATLGMIHFERFQGLPFGWTCNGLDIPTNYQLWYRDAANTCSGAGMNFSNGWSVAWLP